MNLKKKESCCCTVPDDDNKTVDHDKISAENAERLAQMSLAEIEEQRAQLLAKLDPKMIEFIRKRRKPPVKAEPAKKVYQTETGNEVKLPIETKSNWLNMKQVEPDKLEWMQEVKTRELRGDVKIRVDFQVNAVTILCSINELEVSEMKSFYPVFLGRGDKPTVPSFVARRTAPSWRG